jgi:hypothetical protein
MVEQKPMSEDIDLHDATLVAIRVNWGDGICVAELQLGTSGNCALTFSALSHLTLPRKQSWGRSVSINSFSVLGNGHYEIEMQSGDIIRIGAMDMVVSTPNQN